MNHKECQDCNEIISGNYCSNCGQVSSLQRIDKKYAFHELLSLLGYQKGFLFTCKKLLIRPGETVQNYIYKNRNKITKPITFVILTSVIYTLISHQFKFEYPYDELTTKVYEKIGISEILNWIQQNYGYANLLMIFPITIWTKIFFIRNKNNFFETFVLISYVMGFGMLIFSIEPILNNLSIKTFFFNEMLIFIISFMYMGWAIGQFYGKTILNYLKGTIAYCLGFFSFYVIMIILGIIYSVLFKA